MRSTCLPFVLLPLFFVSSSVSTSVIAAPKGKTNNSAQEKKDDANVQRARQDVNEAEKKIQSDIKEVKAAEAETKKSLDAIATARKSMDETSKRLENWISQNLGIPEAIEGQRASQTAYDAATKPLIAAMKTNPKYMPLVERAEKADKLLKSLVTDTQLDEATRKQQQSAASKELADLRSTVSTYLESLPELQYPREKLLSAQKKLADLRSQLKKQLEMHPDLKATEKKYSQAKDSHEKDTQRVATLRRKAAADQSKLISERAQLTKAAMQDKQNDMKNNNNNNKNKNKNNKNNNKK